MEIYFKKMKLIKIMKAEMNIHKGSITKCIVTENITPSFNVTENLRFFVEVRYSKFMRFYVDFVWV